MVGPQREREDKNNKSPPTNSEIIYYSIMLRVELGGGSGLNSPGTFSIFAAHFKESQDNNFG